MLPPNHLTPLQPGPGDGPLPAGDRLLDRQDMLQIFHISARTLQHWRSKGVLPCIKIGHKIYYRLSHVQEMLQANTYVGGKS